MGTSTVSGPFRSANGFQELVNGQWVPVAGGGGGGGGGGVLISLTEGFYGPDNRYSDSSTQDPPTGPTAGTIVQLPLIEVGQSYFLSISSQDPSAAWAVQLPTISGVALSAFWGQFGALLTNGGTAGIPTPAFAELADEPTNVLYLYGGYRNPICIIRVANVAITGFGTVAFFKIVNTPLVYQVSGGFGNPIIYPFDNVLAP